MTVTSCAVTFKIPQKIFNAAPLFFMSITVNSLKFKPV